MNKVNVYYGPKNEFETILPKRIRKTTLVELAVKSDARKWEHLLRIEGQQVDNPAKEEPEKVLCLVAYSDEYAGLSENAIQSFVSFISQFDIKHIYLQNPPLYIVEQLKKVKKNIKFYKHRYNTMDLEHIRVLNNGFSSKIIGQDDVRNHLITALYPLCRPTFKKPLVLMFYGPTGVGKTETAKFLSDIFNEKLFRKQFSMFHSEDFASYIFGGRHSQNSFSKELLERESNIILLDEFDKPNPVFHSAFYQLFDDGIFEDKNYSVEVEKAIIICTSNYASEEEVRRKLGDPIFSRFDAVIKFNQLKVQAVRTIINNEYLKQLNELCIEEKKLVESSGILDRLLKVSDKLSNARQVKKVIREAISSVIVWELLK
ncbi:MAG: hypothetical protein A2Y23_01840 [Clostridiales bacterium GWB2_37_7]|nr:MAG: hypothetical protein A2Y23_01840 [Clostridiales bacterium GWB2_37_7]